MVFTERMICMVYLDNRRHRKQQDTTQKKKGRERELQISFPEISSQQVSQCTQTPEKKEGTNDRILRPKYGTHPHEIHLTKESKNQSRGKNRQVPNPGARNRIPKPRPHTQLAGRTLTYLLGHKPPDSAIPHPVGDMRVRLLLPPTPVLRASRLELSTRFADVPGR